MKEKLRQFVLFFFPLISLKKDQVSSLNEKGGKAALLEPESSNTEINVRADRAEKRLRMRHLRAGGSSAGKSRLEQHISNVKSIAER